MAMSRGTSAVSAGWLGQTGEQLARGLCSRMRFLETPIFTRSVTGLLEDEAYRSLQLALLVRPAVGPVIPGSRGLRKVRWSVSGKGKRGGCRIIDYWDEASETYDMLYAYAKGDRDDLTADQLRTMSRLVREEFS
jgi:hypothetical protein